MVFKESWKLKLVGNEKKKNILLSVLVNIGKIITGKEEKYKLNI